MSVRDDDAYMYIDDNKIKGQDSIPKYSRQGHIIGTGDPS